MIRFRRVLLATDFSGPAAAAADYARSFAEKYDAEFHVLHVVDEVAAVVFPEHGAAETVQQYVALAVQWAEGVIDGVPGDEWKGRGRVLRAVRRGVPVRAIIDYAREQACDLIVMGTHGRTGLSHLLTGSVADRVLRTAPCPVLTVRPPADRSFEP